MKQGRWIAAICVAAIAIGVAGSVIAGGSQHRDIFVGKTKASALSNGEVLSLRDENDAVLFLSEVDGILKGWADNNPGWNAADGSAAGEEPMSQGAQLFFEVSGFDGAFKAYDQVFNILHDDGDMGELGGHDLHVHYTWHVDTQDAEFDADRVGWTGAYEIVDLGTTEYGAAPHAVFFRPEACASVIEGDVDQDGIVSPLDIQAFWSVVADPSAATMQERCACDLNHDGIASADDAPYLMSQMKNVRLF